MINLDSLKNGAHEIGFRPKRQGVYKILTPFYYEDGDMYDIFLEILPGTPERLKITDYGLTIMKLSYTLDINTKPRKEALTAIVAQNRAKFDNGEIFVETSPDTFQQHLYMLSHTLMKVSCIELLNRGLVKSLFYELFQDFVKDSLSSSLGNQKITSDFAPLPDDEHLIVDFKIHAPKPIFLYGVKDSIKASKVIIGCLNFQQNNIPFRSLIVHEDFDKLDSFNKKQITNISDKQFWSLEDFIKGGMVYVNRELVA